MSYTAAQKRTFDPGPCPTCSGTDADIDWIHVPFAQVDDAWIPGECHCLNPECGSVFVGPNHVKCEVCGLRVARYTFSPETGYAPALLCALCCLTDVMIPRLSQVHNPASRPEDN